ncbi:hypothetical protein BKA83DRAFT_4063727, partial [Pisolithus microcarpus]
RTRAQRYAQVQAAWESQIPALVEGYLAWKHRPEDEVVHEPRDHVFHVDVISIPVIQKAGDTANVALVHHGLLGCSPTQPSCAVTFHCLELFHQIRRRQSSFSVQAMAKVLCALHNVTYTSHFHVLLVDAFNTYLRILRHIQTTLKCALGRDGSKWKLRGACLACAYEQPGEPKLCPRRLHSMDGNLSAKRLDGSGSADMWVFNSDYFIPQEKVNQFKDSVQSKSRNVTGSRASTCSDNWVVAKAVQEDQVQVFQQTGIFVLACHHGFVECIAEMRRSGELAKYALAIVEQVLDICGPDQAIGHDIGCSSRKTILSSLLGQRAKDLNLQVVINAFHGFAHNHVCQLQNHLLYLAGLGIEDLKTCERIFANSNSTAALIRHASSFHWMQFLDLHFDQWDSDKYLELSQFLFNNYQQALRIIRKYEPELKDFQLTHGISDEDIVSWHHEELEYLRNCSEEPDSVTLAVKYVKVLEKLHFAEATYASVTQVPFLTYTPADFQARSGLRSSAQEGTMAINAEYASALRRYELRLNEVANFEQNHNITEHWTRDHPQYNEALEYVRQRTFIQAIEELEGLVVQRLAELSKANLAGTGYKMRKHLSKAITRRSTTICTALERYNKLAPRQCPPRPRLDFADVIGYSTFGEFELLKYSRYNILEKPWMKPLNREMSMKFFRLVRSREEIERLNVEVRRLQAWVDFDDDKLQMAVSTFEANGMDNMAAEMREWYLYWHRINDIHCSHLSKIYGLTGYTGVVPSCVKDPMGNQDHNDEELDEVASDEVLRLSDTLEHMK